MKKAIAFACVALFVVAGCGKKNPPVTSNTADLTPPPPPSVSTQPPAMEPYTPTPQPPAAVEHREKPAKAIAATPKPAEKPAVAAHKPATAKSKAATSGKVYVVKKGDTLAKIAKAHKTTVSKIKAVNPKINPDKILVGQKINLP